MPVQYRVCMCLWQAQSFRAFLCRPMGTSQRGLTFDLSCYFFRQAIWMELQEAVHAVDSMTTLTTAEDTS